LQAQHAKCGRSTLFYTLDTGRIPRVQEKEQCAEKRRESIVAPWPDDEKQFAAIAHGKNVPSGIALEAFAFSHPLLIAHRYVPLWTVALHLLSSLAR
jgi:hypothetical protein